MPGWVALLGTLGLNYWRYKHGKPTICATFRRYVPKWAVIPAVLSLAGFLIPHLRNAYPPRT